MKNIKFILLFSFLIIFTLSKIFAYDLKAFSVKYNVSVILSIQTDTWNKVTYELLSDSEKEKIINLVVYAFSKYPDDFFNKISLKYLVLGKDVKFDNVERAAVPDNYKNQLFLSYNSKYHDYYLVHCIFHEINHYVEFYLWKDYKYKWIDWEKLYNGTNKGGEFAYNHQSPDFYTISNKLEGFLNLYSTLGEEEDRSEIIAFFMTDINKEHIQMMRKVKKDIILQRKVSLILNLYKEKLKFGSLIDEYNNEMSNN